MKILLATTCAMTALICGAVHAQDLPTPGAPSGYAWKTLKTGAGGWIVGVSISADGKTVFGRTDTGGAFRWDEGAKRWTQIVSAGSMPAEDLKLGDYEGVASLVAAPMNSSRAYMAWEHGWNVMSLYRSDDRGDHWQKMALPALGEGSNGSGRQQGERLAVDPVDADHVLYGSQSAGLFVTRDAGKTWHRIAAIPVSPENEYGVGNVIFDPNHAGIVYATVHKAGVYRSTDNGDSWTRISGGAGLPDDGTFQHVALSPTGVLYVADPATSGLWAFESGGWKHLAQNLNGLNSVAADPFNANRLFVFDGGGTPWRSLDGGATWTQLEKDRTATDVPWLAWTDESYFSIGTVIFDPKVPGRLWAAQGIGVWRADPADSGKTIHWQSVNTGIEQLVTNDVIAPPGGKVVTASWDRAIFYHADNDAYPAQHAPTSRFNSAWDLDYSAGHPNFVVATVYDHRQCCSRFAGPDNQSGFSEDGGKTWTVFPAIGAGTLPADLTFGDIAVAAGDTKNIVWLPTNDKAPYYTTDRGTTWTKIALPGASVAGSHPQFAMHRHVLTADTVDDRTFYLLYSTGQTKLYVTHDGGASWTGTPATGLAVEDTAHNATLKAVPGHAGQVCVSFGMLGRDRGMSCSTDAGAHWQPVPNAELANVFGFGKPAAGASEPTLFIQGKVHGEAGVFCSADMGAHWGRLANWPLGYTTSMSEMDGDKTVFGKVYAGIEGNGWMYGDPGPNPPADLCGK